MKEQNPSPNARANVGFSNYADGKVLEKALAIYDGMNSVDYFPTPPISMPDFLAGINLYQASLGTASSKDKNSVITKNQNKRNLIAMLVALGNYVTLAAEGDRDIIALSRYDVRKLNQPAPPLEAPQGITVTDGVNSGEIISEVKATAGAHGYIHSAMAMPATEASTWKDINCTSRRCTFKGLTKKVEYIFRVAAMGTRGQITYSNTVTRVAQ